MKKQQIQELSTRFEAKGDEALFGGASTNDMKRKLGAPDGRPLADFLITLAINAKDFATEMTSHNVLEKDLHGTRSIGDEHVASNTAVRCTADAATRHQAGGTAARRGREKSGATVEERGEAGEAGREAVAAEEVTGTGARRDHTAHRTWRG
jgi:hypothetical protein